MHGVDATSCVLAARQLQWQTHEALSDDRWEWHIKDGQARPPGWKGMRVRAPGDK